MVLFTAYTAFFYKLIDFHKIKQNPQRMNNNLLDILHRKENQESKIISTIWSMYLQYLSSCVKNQHSNVLEKWLS